MDSSKKVLVSKKHVNVLNDPNSFFNTTNFDSQEMALFFPRPPHSTSPPIHNPTQSSQPPQNPTTLDKGKMARYAFVSQYYQALQCARYSKFIAMQRAQKTLPTNSTKSLEEKESVVEVNMALQHDEKTTSLINKESKMIRKKLKKLIAKSTNKRNKGKVALEKKTEATNQNNNTVTNNVQAQDEIEHKHECSNAANTSLKKEEFISRDNIIKREDSLKMECLIEEESNYVLEQKQEQEDTKRVEDIVKLENFLKREHVIKIEDKLDQSHVFKSDESKGDEKIKHEYIVGEKEDSVKLEASIKREFIIKDEDRSREFMESQSSWKSDDTNDNKDIKVEEEQKMIQNSINSEDNSVKIDDMNLLDYMKEREKLLNGDLTKLAYPIQLVDQIHKEIIEGNNTEFTKKRLSRAQSSTSKEGVRQTESIDKNSKNLTIDKNQDKKTRTAIRNRISAQKSRDKRNARIQCLADANQILIANSKKAWLEKVFLQQKAVELQKHSAIITEENQKLQKIKNEIILKKQSLEN